MNLLLDSHVLLWALVGSAKLTRSARAAIHQAPEVYVSAASAWELAIKAALGKLRTPDNLELEVRRSGFLPLPVTFAHAAAAAKLPLLHRDPFDRMLVAQASVESLTLLTSDSRLKAYGAAVMLA
jgi:PIN domain nuclease of toxin-antitoxin system